MLSQEKLPQNTPKIICFGTLQRFMGWYDTYMNLTCYICKKRFASERFNAKYCSRECHRAVYKKKPLLEIDCKICNVTFLPNTHHTKYCSAECKVEARERFVKDERKQRYKKRFQILERDKFRCQYCGLSPRVSEEVILHIDHIDPKKNGGKDDAKNLITACNYCNLGKGHTFYPDIFISLQNK